MAKRMEGPHRHSGHPEHHLHRDVHKGHHNRTEHGAHHDQREHHGRGARHDGARGAPHEDREDGNYGRSYGPHGGGDYASGRDAAYIEPRLIPDYELLPRDDSGGPEWAPYTQEWGDGGYVTGEKAHLSAHGGRDDDIEDDEVSSEPRMEQARRAEGVPMASPRRPPASSRRMSREE